MMLRQSLSAWTTTTTSAICRSFLYFSFSIYVCVWERDRERVCVCARECVFGEFNAVTKTHRIDVEMLTRKSVWHVCVCVCINCVCVCVVCIYCVCVCKTDVWKSNIWHSLNFSRAYDFNTPTTLPPGPHIIPKFFLQNEKKFKSEIKC